MSIVELFDGYVPPSSKRGSPSTLSAEHVVQIVEEYTECSLEIIPSRFDFSDNLICSVRPDPRILARFLSEHLQDKDLIIIDCAPTESILTRAAYHCSSLILAPVRPEYFATIGFPLLADSLKSFRSQNRGHRLSVAGIVINNAFYDGRNYGGPEKARAMDGIRMEAAVNNWHIYHSEIPHSRGFPKMMRGDYSHPGNAIDFRNFAREFFVSIGL